jgi:ABC-type transporter Mla MlaB component
MAGQLTEGGRDVTEPATRGPLQTRAERPRLALSGRIGPDEAAGLCDRVRAAAIDQRSGPVCCGCDGIAEPDVGTIDVLARMALTARRLGGRLELRGTRPDLRELLALVGLEALAVEVVGQAEQREEPLGVEEERDSGDPVA